VTCHPKGENFGDRTPPGPCVPHGGTPEAPNLRRRVVAPVAPQYPLTPSGWHALRAGVWHRHRRSASSPCRVVVSYRLYHGRGSYGSWCKFKYLKALEASAGGERPGRSLAEVSFATPTYSSAGVVEGIGYSTRIGEELLSQVQ
jgi:hypothetical protein